MPQDENTPQELSTAYRVWSDMERVFADWRAAWKSREDRQRREALVRSGIRAASRAAAHGAEMPQAYTLAMRLYELAEEAHGLIAETRWNETTTSIMLDAREMALCMYPNDYQQAYSWRMRGHIRMLRAILLPRLLANE